MNHPFIGIFTLVLTLWTIPWKVYAVWNAAKHNHKKWFVVLLLLNTASILELIYIFHILKKSWADVRNDFRNAKEAFKKYREDRKNK